MVEVWSQQPNHFCRNCLPTKSLADPHLSEYGGKTARKEPLTLFTSQHGTGKRKPLQLFKGPSVDSKSWIKPGLEDQINALGDWKQTDPLTKQEGDVQKYKRTVLVSYLVHLLCVVYTI